MPTVTRIGRSERAGIGGRDSALESSPRAGSFKLPYLRRAQRINLPALRSWAVQIGTKTSGECRSELGSFRGKRASQSFSLLITGSRPVRKMVAEGSADLDGHDLSGIFLLEQWFHRFEQN